MLTKKIKWKYSAEDNYEEEIRLKTFEVWLGKRDLFSFMIIFFMVGAISKTHVDDRHTSEFDFIILNMSLLLHKCKCPAQSSK